MIKLQTVRFLEPQGVHIAGATRYVVTTLANSAFRVDAIEVVDGDVLVTLGDTVKWVPAERCEGGDVEPAFELTPGVHAPAEPNKEAKPRGSRKKPEFPPEPAAS